MDRIFSVPLKGGVYTDVYYTSDAQELRRTLSEYSNALFVADSNTERYLPENRKCVVLPPGEKEKNWESVDRILSKALETGMARDSVFVGVGGGVILDMTAFAASLYMRGARAVLVPTTLLSMVDATLGGKTGIDYGGGKNIIGTFFPAEAVIISPCVLKTLNDKEYRCGLGEIVKHAFLSSDERLLNFLRDNRPKVLSRSDDVMDEMIRLSLEVKTGYIVKDPEEKKGIRSALNLGHTFGHALEALKGFSFSHGECVVWGMTKALEAGKRLGITPPDFADSALSFIDSYGFDTSCSVRSEDFPSFFGAIGKDKKKKGGEVKFVLLKGQGEPLLMGLDENIVRSVVC